MPGRGKAETITAEHAAPGTAAVALALFATAVAALLLAGLRRRARERFIDAYAYPPGVRSRVRSRYRT